MSWLAEHVDLPADITARQLGDAMIRIGMEVESVESGAEGIAGPIVVGRVLSYADEPRGIVCGAHNFAAKDLVVVALPGAVLPGGFEIGARKTYGHVSDGMICSVRELGIGDDHAGILVLPPDSGRPGADPMELLGLKDAVLDVAVTTDRGYCLSIRGLAR
ncbi:MAG TPA: phenylalanine--tRNA ligase subunit beta, partial [Jatrophihabitans sp.]|nr:phenylalanine--tRNA ligase subunit beta [Jatrophihabitans sp.]